MEYKVSYNSSFRVRASTMYIVAKWLGFVSARLSHSLLYVRKMRLIAPIYLFLLALLNAVMSFILYDK